MLTFINSYLLPVLSAASLPILIHLLSRRRLKNQPFSDIRFLEEIQRKRMRRIKLRQWILLILRTLAILFIAAAFTRPALRDIKIGTTGSHETTALAIIVDNSFSTSALKGNTDVFTHLKAAAKKILSILKEGDAVSVGIFGEEINWLTPKPSRFFNNITAMLDTVEVSDQVTDISNALSEAVKTLDNYPSPNKEIYIITDDCAYSWNKKLFEIPEDIRVFAFSFAPDKHENRSLMDIKFPAQLLEVNSPFDLSLVAKNFGQKYAKDVLSSVIIDGYKSAQNAVDIPPGASVDVNLSAQVQKGGFHCGYAEIFEDNLMTDNRRYFSFKIPDQVRVLIVGNRKLTNYFKFALNPVDKSVFFETRLESESRLGQIPIAQFDVVIYVAPRNPSDAAIQRLRTFVSDGGGLMLIPGEENTKDIVNLTRILERFGNFKEIEVLGDTTTLAKLGWGKADFEHPIISIFKNTGIPKATFMKIVNIQPIESSVLLRFENDMPALTELPLGQGKILLVGFSVDMRWGDVILSGFFVPLVHRSCQYLCSDIAQFDPGYTVGGIAVRTIEDYYSSERLKIIYPNGNVRYVVPRFVGGKATVFIDELPVAGIYAIVSDSDTLDLFAVNIDATEGNLDKLKKSDRKKFNIIWLDANSDIAKQVLKTRFGVELARPLLILALFILAIEMIIETRWKKK